MISYSIINQTLFWRLNVNKLAELTYILFFYNDFSSSLQYNYQHPPRPDTSPLQKYIRRLPTRIQMRKEHARSGLYP